LKYLIQQLYHTKAIAKENFFYVDKELPKFSEIRTHHDLRQLFETFLQTTIAGRIFIGIDEIQDIQEREMFIRGVLAEYQEQAEIFITGSNGFLLSGDLATYLTGRYMEFTVYPLSFSEFCIFKNVKKIEAEFLEYLKYGGLPGIFKLEYHEKTIFEYLLSVYSSIVLKDIIQHQRVQNVDFFQNLYKYTLSNIGNIISGKSIRDYLQSQHIVISTDTVLNFLHYGEETFLLNKVKSVNPDTKKFFEIYNKYYAGDLGLRNAFV
jgi:predicted AAA+ superfamily ATPase